MPSRQVRPRASALGFPFAPALGVNGQSLLARAPQDARFSRVGVGSRTGGICSALQLRDRPSQRPKAKSQEPKAKSRPQTHVSLLFNCLIFGCCDDYWKSPPQVRTTSSWSMQSCDLTMAPRKHKLQAFLGFPGSPTDQRCLFAKVSGGAAPDRYLSRNINESHFPVNKKVREKRREIVHLDNVTL
jgi:hypothetical protein